VFTLYTISQSACDIVYCGYLETGIVVGGESVSGCTGCQPVTVDGIRPDSAVVDEVVSPQPDADCQ